MNSEDEKYVQELIKKMKMQQEAMKPFQIPERNLSFVNENINNISNQAAINNVQNYTPPSPAVGVFGICQQCGTMHPPIEPGTICPIAGANEIKEESNLTEESISQFVSNLRNIAISQIQSKKIKDGNKLFKYITLKFMKILEEYNE